MPYVESDHVHFETEIYWQLVKEALVQVFPNDTSDSKDALYEQLNNFRARLTELPFDEQVLFYHTDPLEVARRIVKPDLVLSKDHIAEYRKILVRKSLAT
jgi:hypothetical protein